MEGDFRVGAWLVKPKLHSISSAGKTTRVEPKAMQVLVHLSQHAGDVVSKEQLMQSVWAGTFVTEDVLTRCISELRKALEDDAKEPRAIETIPKSGYRLIAPVEGLDRAGRRTRAETRPRRRYIATGVLALVVILAVPAYVAWQRFWPRARPPAGRIMLAVLPFSNLSGDPEQEYFSDGLTDEMITWLGRLHPQRLAVIARTSAMLYKDSKKSIEQIGRELGVDYILEGGVSLSRGESRERAGNRLRINAQLIQVRDQTHLWAESYERDFRDILVLQSEVARAIANEIQLKLTPKEQTRLASTRPVNPEAHGAFLKGRFHYEKLTKEGLGKAAELFQQAITIDPNYAPAYAALATCNIRLGHQDHLPPQEAFPQSKRAAEKALEIDPTLAEAWFCRAQARFLYDWDWSGTEKDLERGLELSPNDAWGLRSYADFLSAMGRSQEAIPELKRARDNDPVSLPANGHLGLYYYYARQYDQCITQEGKTLELDSTYQQAHLFLGLALIEKGDFHRAVAEIQDSMRYGHFNAYRGFLGYAYAVAGDKQQARKVLAEYQHSSSQGYTSAWVLAIIYAGLGEKQKAFASLEKAYKDRDHDMAFLKCWPMFDRLRSDPRFQDLLRRMNLPQ